VSHLKDINVSDNALRKVGVVTAANRDKTCRVSIDFLSRHAKYGKYIRQRTVLHVHDEENIAKIGDRVEIAECRPLSKTKSWVLLRVVLEAPLAD